GQTATAPQPRQFLASLQDLAGPRDSSFFQYYCLKKLGRDVEARERLERFTKTFLPAPTDPSGKTADAALDQALAQRLRDILGPDSVFAALLRDLYAAEVFLSLDAAEDAESYFREAMVTAKTDAARLSAAIVLGQVLLLQGKRSEYAQLA